MDNNKELVELYNTICNSAIRILNKRGYKKVKFRFGPFWNRNSILIDNEFGISVRGYYDYEYDHRLIVIKYHKYIINGLVRSLDKCDAEERREQLNEQRTLAKARKSLIGFKIDPGSSNRCQTCGKLR